MQFIGTGDRILTENFNVGYLYTITFKTGIYINSACIGIGDNFVMFQRAEPDLLFNLNINTADEVDTIELYDSGGGTNDYDDLVNRPQINSHTLTGNMSGADLGLQNTISDLDTIRAGAAAGATAVQPADMTAALAAKQDTLSAAQLAAVNSGITAPDVSQIQTNENNILSIEQANGKKQLLQFHSDTNGALVATAQSNGYSVIITGGDDDIGKTVSYADCTIEKTGNYTFTCDLSGTGASCYIYDVTTGTQIREYYATSSETLTLTGGHTYQIRTYRKGSGTNATVAAMICESALYAISSDMRPYAMSNAEITAWILAHS